MGPARCGRTDETSGERFTVSSSTTAPGRAAVGFYSVLYIHVDEIGRPRRGRPNFGS
jgi:hypothetical protein